MPSGPEIASVPANPRGPQAAHLAAQLLGRGGGVGVGARADRGRPRPAPRLLLGVPVPAAPSAVRPPAHAPQPRCVLSGAAAASQLQLRLASHRPCDTSGPSGSHATRCGANLAQVWSALWESCFFFVMSCDVLCSSAFLHGSIALFIVSGMDQQCGRTGPHHQALAPISNTVPLAAGISDSASFGSSASHAWSPVSAGRPNRDVSRKGDTALGHRQRSCLSPCMFMLFNA